MQGFSIPLLYNTARKGEILQYKRENVETRKVLVGHFFLSIQYFEVVFAFFAAELFQESGFDHFQGGIVVVTGNRLDHGSPDITPVPAFFCRGFAAEHFSDDLRHELYLDFFLVKFGVSAGGFCRELSAAAQRPWEQRAEPVGTAENNYSGVNGFTFFIKYCHNHCAETAFFHRGQDRC